MFFIFIVSNNLFTFLNLTCGHVGCFCMGMHIRVWSCMVMYGQWSWSCIVMYCRGHISSCMMYSSLLRHYSMSRCAECTATVFVEFQVTLKVFTGSVSHILCEKGQ